MSFLAGRLAGKEGAYFFQESKLAVTRLAQKPELAKPTKTPPPSSDLPPDSAADVLPEVLRHSLPSKLYSHRPLDPSSLSTASKWSLPSDPDRVPVVSPDALNPLRAYVSLPQVTFGPRRWQLPDAQNRISASTANDLRRDGHHPPINPEKLKAAAEGLANVGKAFAVATAVVFGGGSLMFAVVVSKLDIQNGDNAGVKVRDLVQPSFDTIKEQVGPLRSWAENTSKKWHLESSGEIKEKPMVKELSRILGVKARD